MATSRSAAPSTSPSSSWSTCEAAAAATADEAETVRGSGERPVVAARVPSRPCLPPCRRSVASVRRNAVGRSSRRSAPRRRRAAVAAVEDDWTVRREVELLALVVARRVATRAPLAARGARREATQIATSDVDQSQRFTGIQMYDTVILVTPNETKTRRRYWR